MIDNTSLYEQALLKKQRGFPGRLYKYRCFDEKDNWKDWVKGMLYFRKPSSFNDPFDCSFSCDTQSFYDGFARGILQDSLRKHFNATQDEIASVESSSDPLQAYQAIIDHYGYHLTCGFDRLYTVESFMDSLKLLTFLACFSETNVSILMWSHYSNNHQGFCIEYDFADSKLYKDSIFPVIYDDNKTTYDKSVDNESNFKSAVLGKASCWNYEKEWRYIASNANFEKQDNFSLDVFSCVKALYVGARISEKNLQRISELATNLSIPLFHMKMDDKQFRLYSVPK